MAKVKKEANKEVTPKRRHHNKPNVAKLKLLVTVFFSNFRFWNFQTSRKVEERVQWTKSKDVYDFDSNIWPQLFYLLIYLCIFFPAESFEIVDSPDLKIK